MLTKLKKSNSEGFTIIEVMIVLAIAGLILLIVFLAVPALQRNARNTQRKSDAAHLAGLVAEYVSNHGGVLPTIVSTTSLDLSNEHWAIMNTPTTANIVNTTAQGSTTAANINEGFTCDPATNTLTAGSSRSFSVTYQAETSSGTTNICVSS